MSEHICTHAHMGTYVRARVAAIPNRIGRTVSSKRGRLGAGSKRPFEDAGHMSAKRKAPEAGVDGNWRCSACGNINFPIRENCNRCQAPKTEFTAVRTLRK